MKIIIVDDETKIADVLAERLALRGFVTTPVYDGESALSMLQKETFAGMILDLRLPGIDGFDVLKQARSDYPDLHIIILSGHANQNEFQTCRDMGATACFQKPANIDEIIKTFETAGVVPS